MKRRLIVLFLWIVWTCGTACENVRAEEPVTRPELSLPLGEHLVYTITWLWIPVGIGEVWVKEETTLDGREVIPIVGVIRTNAVLSKIFPVQDTATSWVDVKTLESVQFEKEIKEIVIKTRERMVFDAAAGKGYLEFLKTGKKKEFDIKLPVHDVLSAFYWLRRQVLVPGQSVKTLLVADGKEWALEAHVRSRETLELHGKEIEALVIDPVTEVEGKVRRKKAWFYVTADASRVPLRIVYKAPFGTMVGTLQDSQT